MNCSSVDGAATLLVNDGEAPLTVLQKIPGSKGKYVKCPASVPPHGKALAILDPAVTVHIKYLPDPVNLLLGGVGEAELRFWDAHHLCQPALQLREPDDGHRTRHQ